MLKNFYAEQDTTLNIRGKTQLAEYILLTLLDNVDLIA